MHGQVFKFADVTEIFRCIDDSMNSSKLQKDLDTIIDWADKWQMNFNVGKCKVMHVGRTNPKKSYHMRGNILEEIDQEKDLGIIISSDLKQCLYAYAYNKANKVLGMIRRTIINKEPRIMMSLYKTLVRPHVEYCLSAWSPLYKKDKELIEKIQHRFTKMVKIWRVNRTKTD